MVYSTQADFIVNLVNGLIPLQFHIVFGDMLFSVVSSTAADQEVLICMVMSTNSRVQVMLDQECDPELDDKCLTDDEQLTCYIRAIYNI